MDWTTGKLSYVFGPKTISGTGFKTQFTEFTYLIPAWPYLKVQNLWIISHKKKEEVQKLFKGFNLLKAQDPPPEVPEEKAEEKTESSTWVKKINLMCSVQFGIRIKLLKPIL